MRIFAPRRNGDRSRSPLPGAGRALAARLRSDERGATVIEFGLCVSAFVALLLAATQTALVYFAQQNLQTSAEAMARKVLTGQVKSATVTADQFKTTACTTLPAFMQCSKLIVDARSASSFSGIDTGVPQITYDSNGKPTNTQFSIGTSGSIVILRLMYPWSVTRGTLGFKLSNQSGGLRLLIGTMVFKSETFQ